MPAKLKPPRAIPEICTAEQLASILMVRPSAIPTLERIGAIVPAAGVPGRYIASSSYHTYIATLATIVEPPFWPLLRKTLSVTVRLAWQELRRCLWRFA